ncbi:MAG: 4Fe-4S dicluster domain-containing protein [Elusimicrobia bacterium]|nr:4Fe-4S dicluster domain-containing protein [Elusimicrobiota bacterium]
MISYFKRIWDGFIGTIKGMMVTLRYLVKPSITLSYPLTKFMPYERFRGVLLYDQATCIGCGICAKSCPSKCITLENMKSPEGRRIAKAAWYAVDLGKCNFCRLCEEACPTKPKSVWHSLDYEAVFFSRSEMVRVWKPGDPWAGRCWDCEKKALDACRSQIPMVEAPARR